MTHLTVGLLSKHRILKAIQQGHKCPVCKGPLGHRFALDHDHTTGQCRSNLCNSCNTSEGKVLAGMLFRTPMKHLSRTDRIQWLRNLANYWEYWDRNPSGIFHPTFDITTGKQKSTRKKPYARRRKKAS